MLDVIQEIAMQYHAIEFRFLSGGQKNHICPINVLNLAQEFNNSEKAGSLFHLFDVEFFALLIFIISNLRVRIDTYLSFLIQLENFVETLIRCNDTIASFRYFSTRKVISGMIQMVPTILAKATL